MPEQVVADGTMGGWSLNRSISVGEVLRVEKVWIRFPRVVFSSYDFFFFTVSAAKFASGTLFVGLSVCGGMGRGWGRG